MYVYTYIIRFYSQVDTFVLKQIREQDQTLILQILSSEVVQNLGSLPDDWTDRYEVAVLCRALWSLDYLKAKTLWAMSDDKPGPNFRKTS